MIYRTAPDGPPQEWRIVLRRLDGVPGDGRDLRIAAPAGDLELLLAKLAVMV